VAGTIIAEGGNDEGVVGVIPSNRSICLLIARVFGDSVYDSATTSTLLTALEWCADNKSRVINMSLGGSPPSLARLFLVRQLVNKENIALVAAAGNQGNSTLAYPASHSEVISVAAVDQDLKRAVFSQYNGQVDVAAPGVKVLSTVPSHFIIEDSEGKKHESQKFLDSVNPPTRLSASVADCGLMSTICPEGKNSFCLIERGSVNLTVKALNAYQSGCEAAIMYNNRSFPEDVILVTVYGPPESTVSIPVLGVSRKSGLTLLRSKSATLYRDNPTKGYYGTLDGTSMATPHVTGAVAKIWAARPKCTNKQVREAIEKTALDLDAPGRDVYTGHGLVQTWAAYNVRRSILLIATRFFF
jgi:serine protease